MSSRRVLLLGATGMLGHKLAQVLGADFTILAAVRGNVSRWPALIPVGDVIGDVDVRDHASVGRILDAVRPNIVINAAGVVKQILESQDPLDTMAVNALHPNMLAFACDIRNIRLVHYSTDCVFTGKPDSQRGPDGYRESDPADSRDLYGMSKLLGEPAVGSTLVLRTSIIGRELRGYTSLMEWFLGQRSASVNGYTRAFFSGLTTLELARVTAMVLDRFPKLAGLWHVSAPVITKYHLLKLIAQVYGRDVTVEPRDDFYCDRRLDGSRFSQATGWKCPDWQTLLNDMRNDNFDYDSTRPQDQESTK